MTKKEIEQFLESRPSLSKAGFCREAGVSYQMIDYIIAGKRNLTEETSNKLEPVMKKYGWSRANNM